jgi:hypothetical protein
MVDYKGQELVERLYQFIILLFSVSLLACLGMYRWRPLILVWRRR